jgi:hypothetical protein
LESQRFQEVFAGFNSQLPIRAFISRRFSFKHSAINRILLDNTVPIQFIQLLPQVHHSIHPSQGGKPMRGFAYNLHLMRLHSISELIHAAKRRRLIRL